MLLFSSVMCLRVPTLFWGDNNYISYIGVALFCSSDGLIVAHQTSSDRLRFIQGCISAKQTDIYISQNHDTYKHENSN